jgi:hypothetical protein
VTINSQFGAASESVCATANPLERATSFHCIELQSDPECIGSIVLGKLPFVFWKNGFRIDFSSFEKLRSYESVTSLALENKKPSILWCTKRCTNQPLEAKSIIK